MVKFSHYGRGKSASANLRNPNSSLNWTGQVSPAASPALFSTKTLPNGAGVFRWARASVDPIPDGDLDFDGDFSASDIGLLVDNLGSNEPLYDLNRDGGVDSDDVRYLVEVGIGTFLGDANLDGRVDSVDLNTVGVNWQENTSGWENGDFNGDNRVDSVDLNALAVNWQRGVAAGASVPEPTAISLILMGFVLCAGCRRHSRK